MSKEMRLVGEVGGPRGAQTTDPSQLSTMADPGQKPP